MANPGAFRAGPDTRRGEGNRRPGPRKPKDARPTLCELCRDDRPATVKALQRLRDQTEEPRIALEAAGLMARYGDGEPGAHNVPPQTEPGDDADDGALMAPPMSPTLEAVLGAEPGRRGGDAGGPGDGNGGGA